VAGYEETHGDGYAWPALHVSGSQEKSRSHG
jgi:hypothetical protein